MNNFFTYAKFTKVNKLVKHQKLQKNIMKESLVERKEFMNKHKIKFKEEDGILIQYDL